MTTRIDHSLEQLKQQDRKGFIAYVTAGDPDLDATVEIVLRLEEAGVDIVELGLPFSDPLADGPVNQESASRALAAGATPKGVLACIEKIRKSSDIPLLCYTYMNPFYAMGMEKGIRKAAKAGLDGVLFLDLPHEEEEDIPELLASSNLNHICLVTPTSPDQRIRNIVRHASGFVYCVSREGVTGMQDKLSDSAHDLVRRTRAIAGLPVALGFGISTPDHARAAAQTADAIVVGSAIVNRFHQESHNAEGRRKAARWVGRLVKAVKEV